MRRFVLCFNVLFWMFGCGGGSGGGGGPTDPAPAPAPSAVSITTGATPPPRFIPASTTLAVGGTATWQNGSPAPHNVISDTGAWPPSADLDPGETFEVTFAQAGTFDYHCSIHPGMDGRLVVR